MRAFINLAVTVVPFVLIGIGIRFLMRRKGVELTDVQRQAGAKSQTSQGLPSRLLAHRGVRPP